MIGAVRGALRAGVRPLTTARSWTRATCVRGVGRTFCSTGRSRVAWCYHSRADGSCTLFIKPFCRLFLVQWHDYGNVFFSRRDDLDRHRRRTVGFGVWFLGRNRRGLREQQRRGRRLVLGACGRGECERRNGGRRKQADLEQCAPDLSPLSLAMRLAHRSPLRAEMKMDVHKKKYPKPLGTTHQFVNPQRTA